MSGGAEKRVRGSPTGATPQQKEKRSFLSEESGCLLKLVKAALVRGRLLKNAAWWSL